MLFFFAFFFFLLFLLDGVQTYEKQGDSAVS